MYPFWIIGTSETLQAILKRCEVLKVANTVPLDSTRADVPMEVVLDHYERLNEMHRQSLIPPKLILT